MMVTNLRSYHVLLVVALLTVLGSLRLGAPAAADDLTPTVLLATPEVTLEPPTVETEPTAAVVVLSPEATEAPTSAPPKAETHFIVPTATPQPKVRVEATPTPTPLPRIHIVPPTPLSAPPPSEAPLPSPAQLEQNARLRWGRHVPASVRRWAFLIVPAAHEYHLSPNLIAAVMTMESDGDPLAWSSADARGLMQVLHGPWDPRENVFTGARMLADLYARFGDWTLALAAYNAGPDAVLAYKGVPPYRETRDYVIVVRYLWDLYDHRKLTLRRRALYRHTLKDLQHFPEQRKKVLRLARIGHTPDIVSSGVPTKYICRHYGESCGGAHSDKLFVTLDPFWPLSDVPDPLQRVGPYPAPS